ncbi:HesA/MoeB/ThiF family protein [Anatilimnocola aggregata]|uniref:HesA/MoeB/ThiF family protein n=1 Tax=Anatilimnocola aggregata TaxID=2528021 RepID=UPI00119EFEF5|nr:ThiF family adenylyltransferase [Anatilimnocola aggregata]
MSDFIIDDDDRYSRLRLISWWDQDKLRAAKILVVGAGALGNEVLKNLSLLGVGKVLVIDLDEIEDSNLTRSVLFRASDRGQSKAIAAAKMLHEINPDTHVVPIHGNVMTDIGLGVFRDVDVVIGCLDNREARLWVNRCCWKVGTPWVDGGIQEISGVAKVFVPPGSACYECAMTENDYRLISLRYSCPLLKREDLLAGKVPTAPTIGSMIAGLQTQEALKLLHGLPVQAGAAMVFNGIANNFYTTHYQRREDCLSHETYPEPISLDASAASFTAQDLFGAARSHFAAGTKLTLELDRDLVLALHCGCGNTRSVMRPQQLVAADEALCPSCSQAAQPEMIHSIAQDHPLASEKLAALGIPAYDIVRVTGGGEYQTFLLAADEKEVFKA